MENVIGDLPLLVALDLNQNIARIEHSRRFDTLIPAHFHDSFLGQQNFRYLLRKFHIADAGVKALNDLVLVPGIRVDEKPLLH